MPKLTIDLSKRLVDVQAGGLVDGTETLATVLASLLQKSPTGDPLKHWDMMQDLCRDKKLEVDTADYDYLVKFLKENQTAWAGARGQILYEFRMQKERSERKTEEEKTRPEKTGEAPDPAKN